MLVCNPRRRSEGIFSIDSRESGREGVGGEDKQRGEERETSMDHIDCLPPTGAPTWELGSDLQPGSCP